MFATNTNVRFWPSNLLIIQKLIVLILKIAKITQNFVRVNKWTKTEMKKKILILVNKMIPQQFVSKSAGEKSNI